MKKYLIVFSIIALVLLAVLIGIWLNKPAENPDDDYSSGGSAISRTAYFYVNSQQVDKISMFKDFEIKKETFENIETEYVQNNISFYWLKDGEEFSPADVQISTTTNFYLILDTEIDLNVEESETECDSIKIRIDNICKLEDLKTVSIYSFDETGEVSSRQIQASEFEDNSPIAVGGYIAYVSISAEIETFGIDMLKFPNMYWQISIELTDETKIFSDVKKIEGYPTSFSVIKNI